MGRKLFVFGILLGVLTFFIFTRSEKKNNLPSISHNKITVQPAVTFSSVKKTTIFVPYWSLEEKSPTKSEYDRSIYFGVTPTENGLNREEPGYQNIAKYNELFSTGQRLLAVRMTDSDLSLKILADKTAQDEIISETIKTALENNFSGITLDLELFSLFNKNVPEQINSFASGFYRASKQNNLYFAQTIYGDAFYRHRPYDVKSISDQADEIMIMAYDFSKSKGEPGPNFPLEGNEKYGYDIKAMIRDFLAVVPREKLSVIFGMYGYDWTVDDKKRPVKPAEVLTDNQIQQKYLDRCNNKNCKSTRDNFSQETNIVSQNHIVWFEDLKSAQVKQDYLQSQGIGSFAFWAFGYF